jgi:hypothetical protein
MNFYEWYDPYMMVSGTLKEEDMRKAFEAGQESAIAENKAEYNLGCKETAQAIITYLLDDAKQEARCEGKSNKSWIACCEVHAEAIRGKYNL